MMTVEKKGKKSRGMDSELSKALEVFAYQWDPEVTFANADRFNVSDLSLFFEVGRAKVRRWLIDGVISGAKRDEKNRLYITRATFKKLYERYQRDTKVETRNL